MPRWGFLRSASGCRSSCAAATETGGRWPRLRLVRPAISRRVGRNRGTLASRMRATSPPRNGCRMTIRSRDSSGRPLDRTPPSPGSTVLDAPARPGARHDSDPDGLSAPTQLEDRARSDAEPIDAMLRKLADAAPRVPNSFEPGVARQAVHSPARSAGGAVDPGARVVLEAGGSESSGLQFPEPSPGTLRPAPATTAIVRSTRRVSGAPYVVAAVGGLAVTAIVWGMMAFGAGMARPRRATEPVPAATAQAQGLSPRPLRDDPDRSAAAGEAAPAAAQPPQGGVAPGPVASASEPRQGVPLARAEKARQTPPSADTVRPPGRGPRTPGPAATPSASASNLEQYLRPFTP